MKLSRSDPQIIHKQARAKSITKLRIIVESEPDSSSPLPVSISNHSKTPLSKRKFPPINRTPTKTPNITPQSLTPTNSTGAFPRKYSYTKNNVHGPSLSIVNHHTSQISRYTNKSLVANPLKKLISQQAAKPKEVTYDEYLQQSLTSLNFIKTFPPVDLKQLKEKRIIVPKKKGYETKKTLIFDLDETLVHCCTGDEPADTTLKITLPSGHIVDAGLNIRPFAVDCLKTLSRDFEIFIFTASHSCYADSVCEYLDPLRQIISYRFYRQHCLTLNGVFIKDLRIFQNRKLKDLIIVENTLHCVAYQLDNCIPIVSWFSNKEDEELLKLVSYLKNLADIEDVRVINKQHFNLSGF